MNNESVELKLARVVTNTLMVNGLVTGILGVVALIRWVF